MTDSPLISIILPVHNGRKYLELAISSCLNQTYENLELIIVDDGSTDDSILIAEEFKSKDSRISIIKNKENLTLPVSLNIGHKNAKGNFITWTSDDNIFQKDAIKKLYLTLVKKNVDIVYSDYLIIDDEGELVRHARLKDIEYLLFYGVIGACFLYKKEVYERNIGYNEKLFLVEDYDFWLRALKHSSYFRLENPVYYFYRYHPNSLTIRMEKDKELKQQCVQNLRNLYSNLFIDPSIRDKDAFIEIIINRHLEGPNVDIKMLESKYFFKDLHIVSSNFVGFSYRKVRRILITDVVETILKNKKFHKVSVLVALHRAGKSELLRLPIDRYFALFKKCIF
ncbi:glycosyltransferase family 2 protein [Gillisia sp. JM1]|uniref:glycosyltransferase family 2 protein n=1 Tax=Gillisia sp. JM1 TaxID=1283286 RepID=UPI0003F98EB8|nr:glycosyltransferase [Gillisia sp. JM1]